jgi:hypothetical protein
MRIFKLLGLALMATLAFSVVGALGAGSASALLFLTESGKLLLFTLKNLGLAILETLNGTKVECESLLGHGFIVHKTDIAEEILLTFHECKSAVGSCTTAGEPTGLIMTLLLSGLLVSLEKPTDKYGLRISSEHGPNEHLATFTCGTPPLSVTVIVKGSVVGEFEETLAESETFKKESKVKFAKNGVGMPAIPSYWTLEGLRTAKLEASTNGGTSFEEASQEVLVDIFSDGGVKLDHN